MTFTVHDMTYDEAEALLLSLAFSASDTKSHLQLKICQFKNNVFGNQIVAIDVRNDSIQVNSIIMAMKLAHGPLHVGDTKGHIHGHDL